MSNIFVIVLKKYPKDYEHTSAETGSAKVVLIVLNRLFEKEDKTLLFIRKDLESHQARDYQEIANYLTKDHVHDFFEESKRFQFIKREYWKHNYPEIVTKERQSHAKRLKDERDNLDYQDKRKFQQLDEDIMQKNRKIKAEEDHSRKEILMWIDNKQRVMKGFLRRIYYNLFSWRGIWRNKLLYDKDPENVPAKIFDFITKNLSKPILKNMVTQGLCYYEEEETEKIIRRKHIVYKTDNWKLLNWNQVFTDEDYGNLNIRFFTRKLTRADIELLKKDYINLLEKYVFANSRQKESVIWGKN